MNNKNVNNKLVEKLYSNTPEKVKEALEEISQTGNSSYLSVLIDLLYSEKDDKTKKEIINLLAGIKQTNAVPELVKAIENEKYATIRGTLVRICWESGLDFTNYFSTFIDLLINSDDYMIAVEAYTVIENSKGLLSKTSIQKHLNRLEAALKSVPDERRALINDAIEVLPSLIR